MVEGETHLSGRLATSVGGGEDSPEDDDPLQDPGTQPAHDRWARGAGIMGSTSLVIGAASYATALIMAHILTAPEFTGFAAGQGLLLVVGNGSTAALPWAVARYLNGAQYEQSPNKALAYGLAASGIQALVLGVITAGVGIELQGPAFGLVVGSGAALISLLAGPIGFFQGERRLGSLAIVRWTETAVRVAVGVGLVLAVSRSSSAALIGFPIGSAAAFALALHLSRNALPLQRMERQVVRELTYQAAQLGAVQVLLAALASLDTVYVSAVPFDGTAAGSYQSAALLGRVPLFISTALSIVAYPSLVAARNNAELGQVARRCLRTYGWLVLPGIIVGATVPHNILYAVIPSKYSDTIGLLPVMCLVGVTVGAVNIVTTVLQARARYAAAIAVLVIAAVVQAALLLFAGHVGTVRDFALADLAVAAAALALLTADGRRWLLPDARARFAAAWSDRGQLRPTSPRTWWSGALTVTVAALLLIAPLAYPLWIAAAGVLVALCGHRALHAPKSRRAMVPA